MSAQELLIIELMVLVVIFVITVGIGADNVIGVAQQQAVALLGTRGLEPFVTRLHVPVPVQIGTVTRQNPLGVARLALGGPLSITVNVFP